VTTGKGRWGQLVGYRTWTEGESTSHEEGGEDEDVQSRRDREGLRIWRRRALVQQSCRSNVI